jgi:hypothetical protein
MVTIADAILDRLILNAHKILSGGGIISFLKCSILQFS